VGCKTGTAEVGGEDTKPHAWITVFAPYEKPEIVVTVLVENGGEGSSVAGPIAKKILQDYFEKR
jgi:penicillin-binding protein 2